jgi:hypothetical protein
MRMRTLRFFRNLFLWVTIFMVVSTGWYATDVGKGGDWKTYTALTLFFFVAPFGAVTLLLWVIIRLIETFKKRRLAQLIGEPTLPPNRVWWGKGA